MKYRYHHFHLICSDLATTEAFFVRDLGATLVERRKFGTADGAMLDLDGTRINLRVRREDDALTGDSASPRFGYDHIGLQVEDVDAAYQELSGKGYAFVVTPRDQGPVRVAFFKGPDNITVELLQPLA